MLRKDFFLCIRKIIFYIYILQRSYLIHAFFIHFFLASGLVGRTQKFSFLLLIPTVAWVGLVGLIQLFPHSVPPQTLYKRSQCHLQKKTQTLTQKMEWKHHSFSVIFFQPCFFLFLYIPGPSTHMYIFSTNHRPPFFSETSPRLQYFLLTL